MDKEADHQYNKIKHGYRGLIIEFATRAVLILAVSNWLWDIVQVGLGDRPDRELQIVISHHGPFMTPRVSSSAARIHPLSTRMQ